MNTSSSPDSSMPSGQHVDVRNPFGIIQLGGTASVGLLGITTLQAWLYYNRFPEDPVNMKIMVAAVWVIEFVRSTFTVHAAYHYLVLNWGNTYALTTIVWSISVLPLTTHLAETLERSYFIWRIWALSRVRAPTLRWMLTGFIVIISVCNLGFGITTYVFSVRAGTLAAFATGPQKIISPLALSTCIATDVAIMASLIFLLNRRRSGFSTTNRLINTLTFYAIQAGVITVVADIVILVLNLYDTRVGYEYLSLDTILGNLYANSLLASLNTRASLRSTYTGNVHMTNLRQQDDALHDSPVDMTQAGGNHAQKAIHVHITRSTFKVEEDNSKDDWPPTFTGTGVDAKSVTAGSEV